MGGQPRRRPSPKIKNKSKRNKNNITIRPKTDTHPNSDCAYY